MPPPLEEKFEEQPEQVWELEDRKLLYASTSACGGPDVARWKENPRDDQYRKAENKSQRGGNAGPWLLANAAFILP